MHITLLSARHVLGPSLLRREGWKDREERIKGGREDTQRSRGRRGAEMESDLNGKEGRRKERGRSERRDWTDKKNGNECMTDEGWNESRRLKKTRKGGGQDRRWG